MQPKKTEEKRISGETYDVNKQTIRIYIALKSTNESRVQYSPEPMQGGSEAAEQGRMRPVSEGHSFHFSSVL